MSGSVKCSDRHFPVVGGFPFPKYLDKGGWLAKKKGIGEE
ncbi:hypothetical protein SPLC1_S370520 [Arthrospira platensis C1]|nr:hypothetical protein SPLC1_S370520 [Arthrospira platensis C1]